MTNNKQRTCGTLLHSLTHFRFHHNLLSGSSLDVVPPKDPGTTTSNNPLPHLPHPVVFSLQRRPGPPLALACLLVLQGQHLHFLPVLYSFVVLVLLVLVSFGSKTRKYKPTTKHTSTSDSFDGPTLPQPPALLAASQHYQYVPREANHCTRSDGRRTDVMRQILVPLRTIDRSIDRSWTPTRRLAWLCTRPASPFRYSCFVSDLVGLPFVGCYPLPLPFCCGLSFFVAACWVDCWVRSCACASKRKSSTKHSFGCTHNRTPPPPPPTTLSHLTCSLLPLPSLVPFPFLDCTDKLRQNDPGFVELSLERVGENFDLDDFCHAVTCNRTVRHVCFSGTFVRDLSLQDWRTLLEHVGRLITLEELQIWCSTVPMDVLAHTLQLASRLHKIYFFRVNLSGTQDDFNAWATSIRSHPALRDVRISGFQIVRGNAPPVPVIPRANPANIGGGGEAGRGGPPEVAVPAAAVVEVDLDVHPDPRLQHRPLLPDPDISLDSVVEALAVVPTLRVLSLQLSGIRDECPFGGAALLRLVCSTNLNDLYLSRLGLRPDHYAVIAIGMASSHNLVVLDLFGNRVDSEHVALLGDALGRNSSLETLVLPCPADDALGLEACHALANALRHNTSLHTLNLPRSTLSGPGLQVLSQALTVNHTLKKLELGVQQGLGAAGTEALTKMLEKNYDLERLVLSSAEQSVKDKVEYYLRLNEVGRGTLLRDGKSTREQWVSMLISVSDDLDCLFYFCSSNPGLFQFANPAQLDVIVTEEIRIRRRHTINNYLLCGIRGGGGLDGSVGGIGGVGHCSTAAAMMLLRDAAAIPHDPLAPRSPHKEHRRASVF